MANNDKEKLQFWVENWNKTGEILEKLRREKIRTANTVNSIQTLDAVYRSAVRNRTVSQSSGLVKFQCLINKMKRDD